jgi:serine/threonine protein kinase
MPVITPSLTCSCIKANIMIDKDGNARLADFGLLTIVSDSTHPATTTSSEGSGTLRWMSPELLDPERFGSKNSRPTKESDCYALGMVILEVLTGRAPFPRCSNPVVMRKIIEGELPDRPKGQRQCGSQMTCGEYWNGAGCLNRSCDPPSRVYSGSWSRVWRLGSRYP